MGVMRKIREAQCDVLEEAIIRYRLLVPSHFDGRTVNSLEQRFCIADTGCKDGQGKEKVYAVTMVGYRTLIDSILDSATSADAVDRITNISTRFSSEYRSLEGYLLGLKQKGLIQ